VPQNEGVSDRGVHESPEPGHRGAEQCCGGVSRPAWECSNPVSTGLDVHEPLRASWNFRIWRSLLRMCSGSRRLSMSFLNPNGSGVG